MTEGRIAVFGATSGPGVELCRLLAADRRSVVAVSALAGDISELAPLDLDIRTLNTSDETAVASVTGDLGADTAIVAFAVTASRRRRGLGLSQILRLVETAARKGVSRFVLVTDIGAGDSRKALPLVTRLRRRKALAVLNAAEDALAASRLSWTVIRVDRLSGRKPTGEAMLVEDPLVRGRIQQADLANLVRRVLDSRKAVGRVYTAVDARRVRSKEKEDAGPTPADI